MPPHRSILISAVSLALIATAVVASTSSRSNAPMPDWLREHMAYMTAEGGRWIADNAAYRTEAAPDDAYGIEWRYGAGQQSIIGRLFAILDGKELGDVWEMRLFWHPKEGKAVAQQFGSDGTFGTGEMTSHDDKGGIAISQTFFDPAGAEVEIAHVSTVTNEQEYRSAVRMIIDGTPGEERAYVWKRDRATDG